jgi:hypothetical protein
MCPICISALFFVETSENCQKHAHIVIENTHGNMAQISIGHAISLVRISSLTYIIKILVFVLVVKFVAATS